MLGKALPGLRTRAGVEKSSCLLPLGQFKVWDLVLGKGVRS